MNSTFKRIIIVGIAMIAIAGAAVALVLTGGCSGQAQPLEDVKNNAVNFAIESSGIKDKVDAKLRSEAGVLAEELGIPQSVVNEMVDEIDVKNWQATTLPADAVETGSFDVDIEGTPTTVTTYEDPSIVTVNAYGQSVTMAVPESAQEYTSMLKYLQFL